MSAESYRRKWTVAGAALLTSLVGYAEARTRASTPSRKGTAMSSANANDLKQSLTPEQYRCTQENGTERPFHNEYWNHKEAGLYVDVVSGEPLFLSSDKYDSKSGWPSFTRAIGDHVIEHVDSSHGMVRREVRSREANSHLGHVFDDGPMPAGQRFCINSASLRFVPATKMKEQGFGVYLFDLAPVMGWQTATFAAGCFWGVQELFEEQPGVMITQAGYTGGSSQRTSYEDVCSGTTGHAEAVQIVFDPKQTTYAALVSFFFRMHDPTTPNRQKNDRGSQYRSAIFFANEAQHEEADSLIRKVAASHHFEAPIVTQVAPLTHFVRAEEYHQDYLHKHPGGYRCHAVAPWQPF